jgi:hypothetical protein
MTPVARAYLVAFVSGCTSIVAGSADLLAVAVCLFIVSAASVLWADGVRS